MPGRKNARDVADRSSVKRTLNGDSGSVGEGVKIVHLFKTTDRVYGVSEEQPLQSAILPSSCDGSS